MDSCPNCRSLIYPMRVEPIKNTEGGCYEKRMYCSVCKILWLVEYKPLTRLEIKEPTTKEEPIGINNPVWGEEPHASGK